MVLYLRLPSSCNNVYKEDKKVLERLRKQLAPLDVGLLGRKLTLESLLLSGRSTWVVYFME